MVYSTSLIDREPYASIYFLNPLAAVIGGFRWCLLGKGMPFHPSMVVAAVLVLAALVGGAFYFRRTERAIVDFI